MDIKKLVRLLLVWYVLIKKLVMVCSKCVKWIFMCYDVDVYIFLIECYCCNGVVILIIVCNVD